MGLVLSKKETASAREKKKGAAAVAEDMHSSDETDDRSVINF